MLLTITTTHTPATDLGFLLHKHPDRVRTVDLAFGTARVLFPEATAERCTAALLVDVDPVRLVRGGGRGGRQKTDAPLSGYVNDRPYAASSYLSVALGKVFRSALNGAAADDQATLAATPIPLELALPAVPCRGGEAVLRSLFEPLGYTVEATPIPLDETVPEWGDSRLLDVRLSATVTLAAALAHLYVLLPVLDDAQHRWIGDAEAEKLLERGADWLPAHPERELIAQRYLRNRGLRERVLTQLAEDDPVEPGAGDDALDAEEEAVERPLSLNQQRLAAVVAALHGAGAARIVDLGCGEGRLVQALLRETWVAHVTGADVSPRALEVAARRLRLERMPERQRARVDLVQGGLTYRDARFAGHDAATLVEVIEHLDPGRLGALEQVVFGTARPATVVVTTPNVEHNVRFEGMEPGHLRHRDHRFEWTRAELRAWADRVAADHGYSVRYEGIGTDDPEVGPPTQMAVFSR